MGFRRRIMTENAIPASIDDFELIDSASRFLRYAERKKITIVPLDLMETCKCFKIQIVCQPLKVSGMLRYVEFPNENFWKIILDNSQNLMRQRFTIAHELGHFCLHRKEKQVFIDQVFFRSNHPMDDLTQARMEWEANEFAAAILMPIKEIQKYQQENGEICLEEISNHFQVSLLAMRYQLDKLNIPWR